MRYRADRRPADRDITVQVDGIARRVTLRGISVTGLKVTCAEPVRSGVRVCVNLLGHDRAATVIWSRGPQAGLKLDHPLTMAELAAVHRPGYVAAHRPGVGAARPFAHRFRELS